MRFLLQLLLTFILSINIFANETTPTKEEVAKLYVATFNRAPDNNGLEYWVNNSGLTLSQIAQSFFDQRETQELYPPTVTNREFIESVYQNLFNREPDSAGWDYWEEQLNIGAFSKNRFIEAVINGALGDDAVILSNKTEVGLYFADAGYEDTLKAKEILQNITYDSTSVDSAKQTIDNHFRRAYEEFVTDFNSNITVNFDDSLPQDEQEIVKEFHNKITAVLSEITGINPTKSFDMVYTPNRHRSWDDDTMSTLQADKLPSEDEEFRSWYTVEIAHIYFVPNSNTVRELGEYTNYFRFYEFNSQTLTSIIGNEYGEKLGFSDYEMSTSSLYFNKEFYKAFQNFLDECNIFSIYQSDTNYNMNSTEISAAIHDFITLYKKDNDFYKNLLSNSYGWNNYIEYKEALAKSIETMDYNDAKNLIDSFKYFKQIDELDNRPDMNIDIALFSSTDFPNAPSNMQFAYDSPDKFIIFGQSNHITPGSDGYSLPDPELYDSIATVNIYDSSNNLIYHNDNVDIKPDFANGYSDNMYNLLENGKTYTIKASTLINGELLEDSLTFTYYQ